MSSKVHQRAVATANSRPIKPPPMMPKRTLVLPMSAGSGRSPLHRREDMLRGCTLVDDLHEGARDRRRVLVLDDVSPVDDARSALLHEIVGSFENLDLR